MASQKELEIVIKPDGKVEITVRGIKGPGCKPIAEKVGKAVGKVVAMRRSREWYEAEETKTAHYQTIEEKQK